MHILSALVFIVGCVNVSVSCPTGWQGYQEKCYFVSDMVATFPDAVSFCYAMNSRLAEPTTPTENNFLEGLLRQHGDSNTTHYYIGVLDYVVEGVYMYASTLDEVSHPDWGVGEPMPPSSNADEDCIVISNYRNDHWADINCMVKCKFVCQRPIESQGDKTERKECICIGCMRKAVSDMQKGKRHQENIRLLCQYGADL